MPRCLMSPHCAQIQWSALRLPTALPPTATGNWGDPWQGEEAPATAFCITASQAALRHLSVEVQQLLAVGVKESCNGGQSEQDSGFTRDIISFSLYGKLSPKCSEYSTLLSTIHYCVRFCRLTRPAKWTEFAKCVASQFLGSALTLC